jgi:thiosulfate dehydrogenase
MYTRFILLLLPAFLLGACSVEHPKRAHADTLGGPVAETRGREGAIPLIPASARIDRVAEVVKDPMKDSLPEDKHVAEQIRLGYDIVRETRKYAGKYVGNELDCTHCHLNSGQRDLALPYVGVAALFPQYRPRSGRLISLEERIRDCFLRSLNGTQPPFESKELLAVSAYITWLSQGQPVGGTIAWRDRNKIAKEHQIPIAKLDVAKGEELFTERCSSCHGADGQGRDIALAKPGPLWGPHSWNDGAAMSRIYIMAGFIRYAMPLTNPGSLTDEEAQHIAAFINSHQRPVYAHKEEDFPYEETPVDAVYYPTLYRKNPLMK